MGASPAIGRQVLVTGFTGLTALTADTLATFDVDSNSGGGVSAGIQQDATGDGKAQLVIAPTAGTRANIRGFRLD